MKTVRGIETISTIGGATVALLAAPGFASARQSITQVDMPIQLTQLVQGVDPAWGGHPCPGEGKEPKYRMRQGADGKNRYFADWRRGLRPDKRRKRTMEQLFFFIFWAGVIFLMMRLGCGAHIMGHSHRPGDTQNGQGKGDNTQMRWVPPKTDIDPVCGKTVSTEKAKPSVHGGNVYYFCSRECREVFEAAPDIYLGNDESNSSKLEHSHA